MNDDVIAAIQKYGERRYMDGLCEGLAELQLFVAWMTRQPDTKRQAETRALMERRILEVKAKFHIN